MKALTIRQPWLWAITHAGKRVENRTWPTTYRGPIALHAASRFTMQEYRDAVFFMQEHQLADAMLGVAAEIFGDVNYNVPLMPSSSDLAVGSIVAVAELVDCVTHSTSPWFVGPFGFVLEHVRGLASPIPCKGALGLWEVSPSVLATIGSNEAFP